MPDAMLLWMLALGAALVSGTGAAELVVALIVAATLLWMALRGMIARDRHDDKFAEDGQDLRSRHSHG
jgi:hypothetical protein